MFFGGAGVHVRPGANTLLPRLVTCVMKRTSIWNVCWTFKCLKNLVLYWLTIFIDVNPYDKYVLMNRYQLLIIDKNTSYRFLARMSCVRSHVANAQSTWYQKLIILIESVSLPDVLADQQTAKSDRLSCNADGTPPKRCKRGENWKLIETVYTEKVFVFRSTEKVHFFRSTDVDVVKKHCQNEVTSFGPEIYPWPKKTAFFGPPIYAFPKFWQFFGKVQNACYQKNGKISGRIQKPRTLMWKARFPM